MGRQQEARHRGCDDSGRAGRQWTQHALKRVLWLLVPGGLLLGSARAQDSLSLSPTRPTIANSASVQGKGVLQVEAGYDAYPQNPPGEQHAVDTAFYYTPWKQARLDFSWSAFSRMDGPGQQATGVGTVQLGTKIVFVKDRTHRRLPGLGFQYAAELPAASDDRLQGYGQQAILLVNHHFGPTDLILNGSVVQTDCQTRSGCTVGGQQSVALSYHLRPATSLYAEVFGQNVSQSNTPPGTYVFGGFLHKFNDAFGIDGGLRFGVSDHSATIGTTIGLVFGKRLQGERSPKHLTP
jgi:hypothetical protein